MLYVRGFSDGATVRAMRHPERPAYVRGYGAGIKAKQDAVAAYCQEIGYEPSILRRRGGRLMLSTEDLKAVIERHEGTTFPQDYEARMLARGRDWESVASMAHADRGALLSLLGAVGERVAASRVNPGVCCLCLCAPCKPDCPAPLLDAMRAG